MAEYIEREAVITALNKAYDQMKLVCTECHYVWDIQGFAFHYCPGCGRYVMEIEDGGADDT